MPKTRPQPMTMDHVYNPHHPELGFQPQSLQTTSAQHPPIQTHSKQQQHLYRNNQQGHILIPHQHHFQINQNAQPILHRPVHPPPPPPPLLPQQRYSTNSGGGGSEASLKPQNQQISTNSVKSADFLDCGSTTRSSIYNYNINTHYQHYNQSSRSHLHAYQQLPPQQRYLSHSVSVPQPQPMTTNLVADNSNVSPSLEDFSEEVIQAILAAKEALEKPIEERDQRDILLIDNLCSLVHGFDVFPKTVRRALAAQAVLIVIDEKGKELIVHNEELDSFCVLIFGECEQLNVTKTVPIRSYNVGDAFGVCEPTTETIRFVGHMVTKCENCAFLCVKRDDFYTILTDPANYPNKEVIRHRDSAGNVVCVSQFNLDKKSSGPLWSHHMQSTNPLKIILPDGHLITKATESCLLMALVDGYDRVDPDYVDDFLLLFRVFMTHELKDKEKKLPPGMIQLCLKLDRWLDNVSFRDRVVKIVLTWLSSYYHDFELNPDFSYLFFKVIEFRLSRLSMDNQLHLLHVTLSTKSKSRQVTISRSSREQPLSFSIAGGYEKNCGIFVTQVHGSNCDKCPHDNLMSYLNSYTNNDGARIPVVPPRHKSNLLFNQDSKNTVSLRPGDQILEVNGTNFSSIKLVEAQKKLDMSTHMSLTVKYNPSAFNEMRLLPDGRRKSSLSSISSVSPYSQPGSQSRFTFNHQEHCNSKQSDQGVPASPLFSSNANFGFRSIIKKEPKNDRLKLSSLINSSKQFVKQIRESTVQSTNNIETISRISDNASDDQSTDLDIGKTKSNPDLTSMKVKERLIESSLSNIVRLDDLNPTSIIEPSNCGNHSLVNVLQIFNAANNEFRYLLVHEETTAREVVMVAVKEFNLSGSSSNHPPPGDKSVSSLNWHLYEVSVVPESKTIKQKCLSEQTSHLADRASLCSRFYIKNNSQTSFGMSRLDMGDDTLVSEILKESPPNVTLTSLNATLLAVELTLTDFDKFRSIEPQQFVYDTFFDYSEKNSSRANSSNGHMSADSASLKSSSSDGQDGDSLHVMNKSRSIPKSWMKDYEEFAQISNKEMFWVVCEILNERNIGRRVKIIKQFVRVADVCSQLRNYNSMFAIISGLGHSCVNRLRRTFDKLKPKYKNQLEKMRSLFDPSKNMSNYRSCLSHTPPPAIPLFPQIKKDLTFTKEGRSIFVRESNEISDDEDGGSGFSQDTIKRRTRPDFTNTKVSTIDQVVPNQTRSISYTAFNNRTTNETETTLVNFAEIRQFTERVRNVIYFSSVPYSGDLLTNTKDSQRTQTQIKKMHEEWQMRKRIRHYISQTLCNINVNSNSASNDEIDGSSSKQEARLNITYDERILYQQSVDIEPELHTRPPTSVADRPPPPVVQLHQPQVPPMALNMHPPSAANSSPTLSKSSSLSSCSSFNHHLPNYHIPRSNLTSSVGKFGTESTESLRKLKSLSENVDDWRPYHSNNSTSRLANESTKTKGIVSSRIFQPKNSR